MGGGEKERVWCHYYQLLVQAAPKMGQVGNDRNPWKNQMDDVTVRAWQYLAKIIIQKISEAKAKGCRYVGSTSLAQRNVDEVIVNLYFLNVTH